MQKGKLLRLDKRGTCNAPWLSQPLTFSSDLPTSLCLFSDPLVITGYLSGFTFQEKPKVFYRNNKWLDQEQFLFAFSGQTYDSWVLFYGLFYCHFRARIRRSLSLKQAGLTELCADFSKIMRNFFPNYAVKIANYAGIMRIAQYLL